MTYHLVLADRSPKTGDAGCQKGEPDRRGKWLIQGPLNPVVLSVATTIRSVTDARAKTSNPQLKKNEDLTLATLKQLH